MIGTDWYDSPFRYACAAPNIGRGGGTRMKPPTVVTLVLPATLIAMSLLPGSAAAEVVRSGTGCLRVSTGTLSKITEGSLPLSPCMAGEVIAHLSGGDITEVATPATGGLQGGTDNAAASLSLQ